MRPSPPFHGLSTPAFDHVVITDGGDRNEFGIPDVPNEPCLLFCRHITMLTLLFVDRAFIAPSLTSPEQFYRLRIDPGQKQLPVLLKDEITDRPLFRRCTNTVESVRISEEQALADTTLRPQTTNLDSITGMELRCRTLPAWQWASTRQQQYVNDEPWMEYCAHHCTGYIKDAQWNIILQHHKSSVFKGITPRNRCPTLRPPIAV